MARETGSEIQPGHFLERPTAAPACGECAEQPSVAPRQPGTARRDALAGLSRLLPAAALLPQADDARPDTSTLAAADFDVDVRSGFMPPEAPLGRLPGPSYALPHDMSSDVCPQVSLWECMLDWAHAIPLQLGAPEGPQAKAARAWRSAIRTMPVIHLNEALQTDIRAVRRAHVVLSFLVHFYMHSQRDVGQYEPDAEKAASVRAATASQMPSSWWRFARDANDTALQKAEAHGDHVADVPPSLAVPLKAVSDMLGLPPVLTYASTVLWNWELVDPTHGVTASNLRIKELFTGSRSESHFFLTSLLIELAGVDALTLMRISLNEAFAADDTALTRMARYLEELAAVTTRLTKLLADVSPGCVPQEFYWDIRPWFRAGDATYTEDDGERHAGWVLRGEFGEEERVLWTGPSAGQSTLIHAMDLFLDVDHTRGKARTRLWTQQHRSDRDARAEDATFMERMQAYMPTHHRAFLCHLRSGIATEPTVAPAMGGDDPEVTDHPIRALVIQCLWHDPDHPLVRAYDAALHALRSLRDEHMRIAVRYIVKPAKEGREVKPTTEEIRGTGGTALVTFLSDCRKNTRSTMLAE
ncbi:hypothetical protein MSPP1_002849 [Malassezia sp. CBS 17886]|nr:hypothetical protein MSPP1_002849 [Malassezia sp. CBS 17886]